MFYWSMFVCWECRRGRNENNVTKNLHLGLDEPLLTTLYVSYDSVLGYSHYFIFKALSVIALHFFPQGLTAAHVRKRAGLPPELPAPSTIKDNLAEFQPAVAKDKEDSLPEDIFTKELDINQGSFYLTIFFPLYSFFFLSNHFSAWFLKIIL